MLYVADNSDIQRHFNQCKSAGLIPAQITLQGVTFEPGGSILVDAGFDLPEPFGELDLKLKVVVKLLSSKKVIRIRLVDTEFISVGIRPVVMAVIDRLADSLVLEGLRVVRDKAKNDIYWEYTPMAWVLLQDILTQDNRLTIVADGVDIPLMVETFKKAEIERLENTRDHRTTMAATIEANRLKQNKPRPAGEAEPETNDKNVPYPAPEIKGDITLNL